MSHISDPKTGITRINQALDQVKQHATDIAWLKTQMNRLLNHNWQNEIASGAADGVNKKFILSAPPICSCTRVFVNGAIMRPLIDYSINGAAITFTVAPAAAAVVQVVYQYNDGTNFKS